MRLEELSIALLPGLDGSGRLFAAFTNALAAQVPAYIVRYPNNPGWEISDYVDHIDKSLPVDGNLLVIAESFSGPLALEILQRRSNIKALILVASFARCPNPILHLLPFIPVEALKPLLRSTSAIRSFCLGRQATQDQISLLRSIIDELPAKILKSRLTLLRKLRTETASIPNTIPILHLLANNDRLVRRAAAPDLSQTSHISRVVLVDGPHFLLQSRAVECALLIRNWIESAENCFD